MHTDLVVQVKCTIFWLNRGLRVFFLCAMDFQQQQKSTSKHFLSTKVVRKHDLRGFTKICPLEEKGITTKWAHTNFLWQSKKVLLSTFGEILHIQIQIHPQTLIEPKYGIFCLNNKVSVHRLSKKCAYKNMRRQIKIFPQTSNEPEYGAFYWNNKVSVHGLVSELKSSFP